MLKVLLAARLNHVCYVNSLHRVCFPDIIGNRLSDYSFVKHSGGAGANDPDFIAIGPCIEVVSYFTEKLCK